MKHSDKVKRSWVKATSYRLVIIISTLVFVFLLTGNIQITVDVTIVTSIANTVLYFIHERFWNKIQWGKTRA